MGRPRKEDTPLRKYWREQKRKEMNEMKISGKMITELYGNRENFEAQKRIWAREEKAGFMY